MNEGHVNPNDDERSGEVSGNEKSHEDENCENADENDENEGETNVRMNVNAHVRGVEDQGETEPPRDD